MITNSGYGVRNTRRFLMKSLRAALILLLLVIVGLGIALSPGSQQAKEERRNFAPRSPAAKGGRSDQDTDQKIATTAEQQIQALIAEKESRTPARQKIDSQLLYALKMHRGESIAQGIGKLDVNVGADEAGVVTVDVTAIVNDELLSSLAGMGIDYYSAYPEYHTLRANISLDQLETIAALPQIRFIQPKQEAMLSVHPAVSEPRAVATGRGRLPDFRERAERVRVQLYQSLSDVQDKRILPEVGSKTSEGDTTHKASNARTTFGANGAGVRIGVLSDGVSHLSASQASGDLGPVTVLGGQIGLGDEGTAMLEIIHDLAPGAQLYFATAINGIASFARNIRDLRAAGCDIIIDDVGYPNETAFQNGQAPSVISTTNGGVAIQAVNDVTAAGALYFSSAANSGNKNDGTSGTWEGDFVDGGALTSPPSGFPASGKVHDFDPSGAVSQFDTISAGSSSGSSTPISLSWADPLGGSTNDYDLFVLNSTGTSVISSSTNIQSGVQDPLELVSATGANATNPRI